MILAYLIDASSVVFTRWTLANFAFIDVYTAVLTGESSRAMTFAFTQIIRKALGAIFTGFHQTRIFKLTSQAGEVGRAGAFKLSIG